MGEPQELHQLYEQVKGVVWVLKIEGQSDEESLSSSFAAFAVHSSGLLMTCAHRDWSTWPSLKIFARPLAKSNFRYRADVVDLRSNCDISILRLQGNVHLDAVAEFGSGHLTVGDKLFLIGHPDRLVGSGVMGSVEYPCIEDPEFNFDWTQTCRKYKSTLSRTPTHRIMGHVWHKGSFENGSGSEEYNFEKNLLAMMPIIQLSGLVGGYGASGGPLFNTQGQVVGMLIAGADGYEIGTHVSVLSKFLQLVIE